MNWEQEITEKMNGSFDYVKRHQEVKTLRWINGTFLAGDEVIVKQLDKDKRPHFITMEVKGARSTVKTSVENGKPVITLLIRGEGNVAENSFDHRPTLEKSGRKKNKLTTRSSIGRKI